MQQLNLTESRFSDVQLSDSDAELLRQIGQRMVSALNWWGAPRDADVEFDRSVIQMEAQGDRRYRVKVLNMVGVICLEECELYISPKISTDHFLYLAQRTTASPRSYRAEVGVAPRNALLEVLARWLLDAAEALLRQGLRLDYQEFDDELFEVRGQIMPLATTIDLLRGRPIATCRFDELSEDTALNRVIRAACRQLAALPLVSQVTRTRARRVAYRFNCSALRHSDLTLKPDRLARGYFHAWSLAALVLRGLAISLSAGQARGSTFLIRTPELIEEGLRAFVADALPEVLVAKRRLLLAPSALSVNPDLTFNENCAVGDVKYRTFSSDWNRGDLYQTVSFAAAFRARFGIVIGFTHAETSSVPPKISLGDVSVAALAWEAASELSPEEAGDKFMCNVQEWWASVVHSFGATLA